MRIGFIGLGNMGGPMARNLLKAGYQVAGYDIAAPLRQKLAGWGGEAAASAAAAVAGADVVITMLPAGQQVSAVYTGDGGVLESCSASALLIDCSTIDVTTARKVASAAAAGGREMLDAPVSGGTAGAEAGTLTFMVGGTATAFQRAQPVLAAMGKNLCHAGPSGNGQAAKVCNNLMLAITMIGTCEAFLLADKLGLEAQTLFDISSKSSGQSWSLTSYCPVPGPVPNSPANRDYKPGFTAAMMLKDLKLAAEAAQGCGATSPLGAAAQALYGIHVANDHGAEDFSSILTLLRGYRNAAGT